MDSPQSHPSSTPLGNLHSFEHIGPSDDAPPNLDAMGLPWCTSCRPFVHILLSQRSSPMSFAGASTSAPTWAFASPFPDYICVPALVHRSQLAVFATPVMNPTVAASPAPSVDSGASNSTNQRKTRGVKIACTNCRMANKKCDEGRPCGRCVKQGISDSCVSAERKPRTRRVKQTTTAITVSATQVAVETPTSSNGASVSIPPSVHITAGTTYVNDGQDMADASYSSPTGSPDMGDLDTHFDAQLAGQFPNYSVYANFWGAQPTFATGHQYPNWGYSGGDGTHQHPPTQFDDSMDGLSPDGCEGAEGTFLSPGQKF